MARQVLEGKTGKATSKYACMICGDQAEFCMRGIPENIYCKPCAEGYFKLIEYLDRL
jgi:hypothetical protein